MTKVAILDDEVVICETLRKFLTELGYFVPDYALNYEEGVRILELHSPDIFLLDINIGLGKSGIDFAKLIREKYNIPLIFISSYSDRQTIEQAREVKPNGYLVKPFSKEDLFSSIEIALSHFTNVEKQEPLRNSSLMINRDTVFIKQDQSYHKLLLSDLIYFKSDGVYVEIFTDHSKYLIRETLKNLIEQLPPLIFFQCHRSYIINLNKVSLINPDEVKLSNILVPLSKTYKEELLRRIATF